MATSSMLKNWIITDWRTWIRHKAYALINVFGLVLGIGCSVFIFLLVKFDFTFDTFQPYYDRLYRVNRLSLENRTVSPETPLPIANTLANEFHEIRKTVLKG